MEDVRALQLALLAAGERLYAAEAGDGVTEEVEKEFARLADGGRALTQRITARRRLPSELVEDLDVPHHLQETWTRAQDAQSKALGTWVEYADACAGLAEASRTQNISSWNQHVGQANVLAFRGPRELQEALDVEDEFHTGFRAHVKKEFGFDPGSAPE